MVSIGIRHLLFRTITQTVGELNLFPAHQESVDFSFVAFLLAICQDGEGLSDTIERGWVLLYSSIVRNT